MLKNKTFLPAVRLILASSSPRRIEMMKAVFPTIEVMSPEVDENITDMLPEDYVLTIAEKKAMSVVKKVDDSIVVSADTIVTLDNKIFGKPKTEDEARDMLKTLRGKEHFVYTGVFIVKSPGNIVRNFVFKSIVKIKMLSDSELEEYIKTASWQDKAGAYGIQEEPNIVESYKGDYNNIVGLPIDKTVETVNRLANTSLLTAEDIAFPEGNGVVKKDKLVIFVPNMIPGDKGEIRIVKNKKSYAEGFMDVLVEPSPNRIKPECSHFGMCGGCIMQNCDYPSQLKYKEKWVKDNIHKTLKSEPVVHPIVASPDIWSYRNKMEFSFGIDIRGELNLGLHKAGSFSKIVDIKECKIFSPYVSEILEFIREYAKKTGLPTYDSFTHRGFWRYVVVRKGSNNSMLLNVVTRYEDPQVVYELAKKMMEKFNFIKGVLWTLASSIGDAIKVEKTELMMGIDYLEEQIGACKYRFGVFSFIQTNIKTTEQIYDKLLSFVEPEDSVLDLYSGIGSIAVYVANKAKSVVGIELLQECMKWADVNAGLNNIKNVSFIQGDVKKVLFEYKDEVKTVILDPPRGGIAQKVVERILELKPSKILYLSCQPATFTRDLNYFEENNYITKEIFPYDMFPHTGHLESLAVVERKE
ncbi:MAG: 23S rRNA (uracil(1939)-C(5))-methyltransferase RlmD [bacterium]|nr:23S rRNA (uracil(1939)-C(5))-methyltransferase RlmD [bacterium]